MVAVQRRKEKKTIFRLTYRGTIPAQAGIKHFSIGLEDDIFMVGNPIIWRPEGKRMGTEIFRMTKELDGVEQFYMNEDFVASNGAIHEGYSLGKFLILTRLNT